MKKLYGVLSIYSSEPRSWSENEIGIALELAQLLELIFKEKRTWEELTAANIVVENSPVVLFRWGAEPDWPILFVSKNAAQFGYTASFLVSRRIAMSSLIHPDDLGPFQRKIKKAESAGETRVHGEVRIISNDGWIHWVLVQTRIDYDADARPSGYQGIIFDITELKTFEEKLTEQKERLQAILDNAPFMTAFLSSSGRLRWVNRTWEKTLGWRLADSRKMNLLAEQYPDPEYRKSVVESILKADGVWREFTIRLRDGSDLETNWVNIRLPDGSIVGLGQDISAAKEDERQRRALEAQLMQAQKLESLGRMAGGVAHDFNNILSVILGYSSLMLQELSSDNPTYQILNEVHQAGMRAQNLTRHLLAFGRKQVMEMRAVSLNEIVSGFERMLRRLIGEDINLMIRLDDDLPGVNADVSMVEQVLLNLAVNSRDAMPGGGTLLIETKRAWLDEAEAAGNPAPFPENTLWSSSRIRGTVLTRIFWKRFLTRFSPPRTPRPAPAWDWPLFTELSSSTRA